MLKFLTVARPRLSNAFRFVLKLRKIKIHLTYLVLQFLIPAFIAIVFLPPEEENAFEYSFNMVIAGQTYLIICEVCRWILSTPKKPFVGE